MNFNFKSQAQLFIGPEKFLANYIIDLIQNIFCKNKCNLCDDCFQITNNLHGQILKLKPEKQYSLEDIDLILNKTSFTLTQNKSFFIILENADLLTIACSNRLLKSIEEPPTGYYFLFLTNKPNNILPTIYSRCTVNFLNAVKDINDYEKQLKETIEKSDIGKFFIKSFPNPIEFLKIIEKTNINEHESIELLDALINYWSLRTKKIILNTDHNEPQASLKILNLLHKSYQNQIMPGSSKIFWKNLYMNFYAQYQIN